jgi:hypothetical protein
MPIPWVKLKVTNGPYFAKQVDYTITEYVRSQLENEPQRVKYIKQAVASQVDKLEGFISTIDEDTRCIIFQKQSRRLRKLLQVRPEEYVKLLRKDGTLDIVANAEENTDPMFNIRGSITEAELGSPAAKQKGGELVPLNADNGNTSHQFDLPLPPGVDQEITADESKMFVNVRNSGKKKHSFSKKQKKKVYPWESGADTGENIVGPATEFIPSGGAFAVQFVLSKEEFQHYKARRQILDIQRQFQEKKRAVGSKEKMLAGSPGSIIHKDFVHGKKKSAIETYSALRTGPYIEPSYNSERIYRNYDKSSWVSDQAFTTSI